MNDNNFSITILWATQSGRAKACARRTIRLLQSSPSKFQSLSKIDIHGLCTFDDIDFLSLGASSSSSQHTTNNSQQQQDQSNNNNKKKLLILFISTTGDAELPSTIQHTWSKLLSKSLSPKHFSHVQFALFALGDRAYGPDAFCAAGRKLAARLVQLDASPICQLGYGDDGSPNGGVFADLDVWLEEQLFPVLGSMMMQKQQKKVVVGGTDMIVDNVVQKQQDDVILSPYEVKVVQKKHQEVSRSTKEEEEQEEWQKEEYQQYYNEYFTHSRPTTAYQYNDQLERIRIDPNNSDNGQEEQVSSNNNNNAPLLGCVTVNERITAKDWMQDTRHVRIHVVGSMSGGSSCSNQSTSRQSEDATLPYQAGDIATIIPSNPSSLVERFLSLLPTSIRNMADEEIHIQYNNPHHHSSGRSATTITIMNHPWPTKCTLRGLLTHCADIQSLPEREDLFALSSHCNLQHTNGQDQHDKLLSLSETSGAALYGDYIIREKRNWVDVFYDFDSIHLKMEELLCLLPSMSPRHFSIASSPSYIQPQQIVAESGSINNNDDKVIAAGFELELCVAVVEGTTPLGRSYTGCCSKYLSSIVPYNAESSTSDMESSRNSIVRLWIHPGSFSKLPLNILEGVGEGDDPKQSDKRQFQTPIMCIGAGTGIAPLRSLIFERQAQLMRKTVPQGSPTTIVDDTIVNEGKDDDIDNILVFGCRKKAKDYYYGKEWEALITSKHLQLIPAFSRDQQHKLYVQRALREANGGGLIVNHILKRQGAVYIAGGSKMARAVKDEIVEALAATLDGGEKDAKRLLNKLKRKGLFSIEAWS